MSVPEVLRLTTYFSSPPPRFFCFTLVVSIFVIFPPLSPLRSRSPPDKRRLYLYSRFALIRVPYDSFFCWCWQYAYV
jgi:hypothetical protein